MSYLLALTLTLHIESLAVLPFRERRPVLAALLALNLVTHPLATLALLETGMGFCTLELGVILVEGAGLAWISGLRPARALWLAIVANSATIALSLLIPVWA